MKQVLFSLTDFDTGTNLGIYLSREDLGAGVDRWSNRFPLSILTAVEFMIDDHKFTMEKLKYLEGDWDKEDYSVGWEFCYVPKGSSIEHLQSTGCDWVPAPDSHGKNLVNVTQFNCIDEDGELHLIDRLADYNQPAILIDR